MKFHHELAAADPGRQGIGISRVAGCLKEAFEALKHPHVKAMLKDDVYAAAMQEVKELEASLNHLDFGDDLLGAGGLKTVRLLQRLCFFCC